MFQQNPTTQNNKIITTFTKYNPRPYSDHLTSCKGYIVWHSGYQTWS